MKLFRILVPLWFMIMLPFPDYPGLHPASVHYLFPGTSPDVPIKIGLLITDKISVAAKNGAEMAVRKANENGGFNGKLFTLVIRTVEGPWGAGSKEAVSLIFDDEVCAIVGCHDGRNAHLVEQVSAKARIVFLSAWATDPTLSQAFVPWYFSCVPNDLQQADALIGEIYNKRKLSSIAVVSDNDYDAKLALTSFLKRTKAAGKSDPLELYYDNTGPDFNTLVDRIEKSGIKAIVLFGQPSASLKLIERMRQRKILLPVFGSLNTSGENAHIMQELNRFENVVLVSSGQWFNTRGLAFGQEFQKLYGYLPDAVSAYAYDGMNLIIAAIRKSGRDRDKIQKALSEIHLEGATGTIRFDEKGNRTGKVCLMEMKNGHPMELGVH
jgi:branched-chain amino acid transport system substrate-binding protein